jgi:nitrous oxide reductase
MSQQKQSEKLSRRGFLKSAAVAGGAAGVAALGSQVQAGVDEQTPAAKTATSPAKGYRETPHVREYYAKARF